ncbi:MAG: SHOCT domain-containing protein [Desulfuromonadaceae bacterium]|nr:SHOCT domain-containing protein [Desulfuromonadaceae bacterium]MDD2849125.1 SHOCT domain-containing protein [Desulfuromonadaceae bacterium]MDD4129493.1 SHOCT domain-containing protein [Desulfuromonadaceae bacterium]
MGIFDKVTEKIQQTKNDIRPKFLSVSEEELKKLLIQGESLVSTITQAVATSAKTLILTNIRIIVYDHGMLNSSFKDYYFRDMKDARFDTSVLSGGTITINADKGNNAGSVIITDLPLQESKHFYTELQGIERNWWEKKRELELEEKRAVAGGTNISMATPQNANSQTPVSDGDVEGKLLKLKGLFDKGLIDESEYKERKRQLLAQL